MIPRQLVRPFSASIRSSSYKPANYCLAPTIQQLLSQTQPPQEQPVTVSGWIKSIRRQKNVSFAVVVDGSSSQGLQAVFVGAGKGSEDVKRLSNGSAVRLTGRLVASPGKGQEKELVVELVGSTNSGAATATASSSIDISAGRVELLGECPHDTYPIQKQSLSNEYLRDHAHLRTRTDKIAAMLRLRSTLQRRIHDWFEVQGFHHVHTPILTGNDAEGAGEAFRIAPVQGEHPAAVAARQSSSFPASSSAPSSLPPPSPSSSPPPHPPIDFFSRPAYLTVSHQLHLEALASSLSRVYTLSPCFRAEPSLTARHLAEFWMLEAEWAFPPSSSSSSPVEDLCKFVEAMLRSTVGSLLSNEPRNDGDISVLWKQRNDNEADLAELESSMRNETLWTRLSYLDAVKELQNYHNSYTLSGAGHSGCSKQPRFQFEPNFGKGLQSEHERWLAEQLIRGPVFVTDYPSSLKPFYMRLNPDGEAATVACFDLLVPHVGELVGGSVREERLDVLSARMVEAGLGGMEYEWYRDLRKYGGAPHGGFGLGFERLVGWVGGIENVRECVPMPRWAGRMLL